MEQVARRPRLDALTGLRYVAALTVLLGHMSSLFPPCLVKRLTAAGSGVGMPLFFVLSGFLMAYNYSAPFRRNFRQTLRTFYAARLARIYPVYVIILLLWFSFVGNFWHDFRNRRADTLTSLAFVGTMTQSWVHVPVFTDYMQPRTVALSYMGVAWSVSTEVFFYLVFPLIALPLARYVTRLRHLLVGGGLVYALYLAADVALVKTLPPSAYDNFGFSPARWALYLCPYIRFGEFLIGAMAGQYFLRASERPAGPAPRWWLGAAVLAASTALLFGGNHWLFAPRADGAPPTRSWWLQFTWMNVLFAPLCAAMIYQLAALPCAFGRLMGCRPMVLLGEMSYCMYLVHPLFQSLYFPRVTGEGQLTKWYIIVGNNLAMVVVLHFFCLGMYRYAEMPLRAVVRNWLDPHPATPTPTPATEPVAAPAGTVAAESIPFRRAA